MNKKTLLLALLLGARAAFAQGTAFTYQGRLSDNGSAASGRYDFRIILFDVEMFGFPAGGPLTNVNVSVSGGLFTTTIDFVTNVFTGGPRWLEIGVRTNGSAGSFTTLDPRQRLTPVPYAIYAQSAPGGGGGVSNLPVSLTSNTVGSIGNQPLELKVNGVRGLRLEPTTDTPNVIGGYSGNSVQPGLVGVTIGGGGTVNSSQPNIVTSGGSFATIAGGYKNTVTNQSGAILGGAGNFVGGSFGAIGAGQFHNALGDYSWIGGGYQNTAGAYASTVDGGVGNAALNSYAFVGGGFSNFASGVGSTVPGGQGNLAQGNFSFAAGMHARAVHDGSFVWGDNSSTNFSSTAPNQFLIRASGGVGINKNNPATALDVNGTITARGGVTASNLIVNGPANIAGLIRSGSETGTSDLPSPAGLVIRRINSTSAAAGQIVARTDTVTLERDGSNAGFLIRYAAFAGNVTVACMGIRGDGASVNFYQAVPNAGTAGTVQIYTDAQDIVHFQCTFGRTFNANQHLTQVTLSRYSADNFWSGTVTSTFNQ